MTPETRHIAILFGGDYAQASLIGNVLAETAKYGAVTTRRIYGDWTTPRMAGWKDSLHSYDFLGSRWQQSEAFGSGIRCPHLWPQVIVAAHQVLSSKVRNEGIEPWRRTFTSLREAKVVKAVCLARVWPTAR